MERSTRLLQASIGYLDANYTPVDWLGSSATAGVTIAVISSWMWFGNSFIMLMAGVQGNLKRLFRGSSN